MICGRDGTASRLHRQPRARRHHRYIHCERRARHGHGGRANQKRHCARPTEGQRHGYDLCRLRSSDGQRITAGSTVMMRTNTGRMPLMPCRTYSSGLPKLVAMALATFVLLASLYSVAADSAPQVVLNTSKAGPRSVEAQTESVILRDYKFAWASLEQALESNSTAPVNGLFVGTANAWLTSAVTGQKSTGLSSRYLNQSHKVEAVFYAPEGDMIELHDTANYDLQILDGGKSIHEEHVVLHYVVLMTPGADRWVVRQLQAVPRF